MKRSSLLGLVALVPMALNVPAAAAGAVLMPMCTGDGTVVMVPLDTGNGAPQRGSENGCCIKACHSGSNRKKLLREFEPAQ